MPKSSPPYVSASVKSVRYRTDWLHDDLQINRARRSIAGYPKPNERTRYRSRPAVCPNETRFPAPRCLLLPQSYHVYS